MPTMMDGGKTTAVAKDDAQHDHVVRGRQIVSTPGILGTVRNPAIRRKILYGSGRFGEGVYTAMNNAILVPYLTAFTSNPFLLGYLGSTKTWEGAIVQPLIGRWSDRMRSPLGRRLPFIVVGLPLSIMFLLLVRFAGHLGNGLALPAVAISVTLFSIFWNVMGDPYQALLVDITSEEERPSYNAILSIVSLIGQGALLLFATGVTIQGDRVPDVVFDVCAVLLFLSFVPVFFVREPHAVAAAAHRERMLPLRSYLREVRTFKEAFKLLVSIFFMWTGLNAILPFLTTFPKKVLHVSTAESFVVYLVLGISVGVSCYPWGRMSGRFGNRALIVAGSILLILSAALGLVVPSYILLFPLAILAGAGFSATTVLTYPYLAELVPGSKIGLFTGLQTAFSAIAVPASVLVTGILISGFGYRAIFAVLAIMMALAVVCLLWINDAAGKAQVRQMTEITHRLEDDHETRVGSARR